METWNVKKFSKLANVTIRTLHYYDKIGLLTPACRLPNGYRVYTKKDLDKLNKITSLKFCGFKLSHIQLLLKGDVEDAFDLFSTQLHCLKAKVSYMQKAQLVLMELVIKDLKIHKVLNWQTMIQFIKAYAKKEELIEEAAKNVHNQTNDETPF